MDNDVDIVPEQDYNTDNNGDEEVDAINGPYGGVGNQGLRKKTMIIFMRMMMTILAIHLLCS